MSMGVLPRKNYLMEELYAEYDDLYQMQTWSIDLLRCIEDLREEPPNVDTDFNRDVALLSAQGLYAALPEIIRKLEAYETP